MELNNQQNNNTQPQSPMGQPQNSMDSMWQNTGAAQSGSQTPDQSMTNQPMQNQMQNSQQTSVQQEYEYGSFLRRFAAAFIDGILLNVFSLFLFALVDSPTMMQALGMVLGWIYFVLMDVKFGWTFGKKVLGLRVVSIETGGNLDFIDAILREVVGKLVSMIVFCIGYLAVLWDPKKQAWHDKIAKSYVIRIRE